MGQRADNDVYGRKRQAPKTREQRLTADHTPRRTNAVSDEQMIDASGRLAAPGRPLPLSDAEWSDVQYFCDRGRLPWDSRLRPARELYGLCGARRVPEDMIPELEAEQARIAGRPVPTAAAATVEVEDDEEELAEGEDEEELGEDDPLLAGLRDLPAPEMVYEPALPPAGTSAHQQAAFQRNQALGLCLQLDDRMLELDGERAQLRQANAGAMAEVGGEQHAAALEELATVGLSRQARQAGIELALKGLWAKREAAQAGFVRANRAMVEADQAKKLAAAKAKLGEMLRMWHEFRALGFELRADLESLAQSRGRMALLEIMSLLGPVLWRDLVEEGYGRCEPTITAWGMPDAGQVDQRSRAVLNDLGSRQAQSACGLAEERASEAWPIVPDAQSWLASLTSDAYRRGRRELERKRAERSAPPPKEAA